MTSDGRCFDHFDVVGGNTKKSQITYDNLAQFCAKAKHGNKNICTEIMDAEDVRFFIEVQAKQQRASDWRQIVDAEREFLRRKDSVSSSIQFNKRFCKKKTRKSRKTLIYLNIENL